jgi:ribosomal protein S18 acetylase RimI-like enzyme
MSGMTHNRTYRPATIEDAPLLAELVNYAGEGSPLYLWGQMAGPGEAAWEVGCQRAAREEGSFSYRNATIIEHDEQCGGCLMQELENLAPATWYINVLAVLPQFRGQGLGTKLMALANKTAEALGKRGISVIVSDANAGARRLYERCGYNVSAARPMVKEAWKNEGQNWVLLTKVL